MDAEQVDPDDGPEITPLLDDNLSQEQWEEIQKDLEDSNDKWEHVLNVKSARATIGVALEESWDQAQKEFNFIRDKLEQVCGDRKPSMELVVDLLIGEESEIFRVFKAEGIFVDNKVYQQFFVTFLLCCSYQVSTKQLYDKDSRIQLDGAMKKEDYLSAWNRIGSACLPSRTERNRNMTPAGLVPFWIKLEEALNKTMRSLFVEGYPDANGNMQTTLDDDKAWFAGSIYNAGLKMVRHIKDNRNGNTCHTMVLSYPQIPISIAWEREVNDSSQAATVRMFNTAITPMAAPGEPGDLTNVATGMDRGYWKRKLLHDFFMKGGGKIKAATTARQGCIPMTYDQKMSPNDTRIDMSRKGPKTLYTMKTTSHGQALYCFFYRNGHGGGTLGISTEYGAVPEWEMVVANPKDIRWYETLGQMDHEQKLNKSFRVLCLNDEKLQGISESPELLDALEMHPIKALTTTQGTPEWFMLRKFSLTSSTTDAAIAACQGNEEELEHKEDWRLIKELLGRIPIEVEADSEENPEENPNQEDSADGNEERSATESVEVLTVDGLLNSEEMIEAAKHQLDSGEAKIANIREVLNGLGHTLSKAAAETTKKASDLKAFQGFLDAEPRLRKHYFKGKKALEKIAKSLGIPDSSIGSSAKAIRESLQEYLESNAVAIIEEEETTRRHRVKAKDVLDWQQYLSYSVWSKAFLNPLKGSAKKYTRRGHQLECHIMRSCMKDHLVGETPIKISKACTAPLVERVGCEHAKDSIDFVGYDEANDRCIGIDVKSRVSNRRAQQETQHVEGIRRLLQCDRTAQQRRMKYFEVDADSPEFSKLVADNHEAVQVLHHAYVYDLDCVLLLVGDNSGRVIYGLFVKMPAPL